MNYCSFISVVLMITLLSTSLQAQTRLPAKFTFTQGKAGRGFILVDSLDKYTPEKGFGFDFHTAINHKGQPFYFSLKVPEGNYKVTVTLGNQNKAANTTVKAESRRLMLESVRSLSGEFITRSFIVNIKDRKITKDTEVALKPRELTKLDWDDKLTLEFAGQSALRSLEISSVADQVTVFLAGNSTVVNQEDEPWASWGQMIPRFFKQGVSFANHAESGLTLGSFLSGKRLDKIFSVIQPGDYLFIEFGHNDQKQKGPNDGAYKSYTERLKYFVSETRKKRAIPVILTSTSRRLFENGKVVNTLGDFPDAARRVALEENVALIDLNRMTETLYNALGEEASKKAFVHYPAHTYPGQDMPLADNTHFNTYGAYQLARCVVEGIKAANLDIAKFLDPTKDSFNPALPDPVEHWLWLESPGSSEVKPDGN